MENILQAFIKNTERLQDRPCFRYPLAGGWKALSWREAEERVFSIARGLLAFGIKKGDRVAICSKTRLEWTLCDLAILSIGAVTVPIYQSNTAEQAVSVIEHSHAILVIVEDLAQMAKIDQKISSLSNVQRIIVMIGETKKNRRHSLDDLERKGNLNGILSLDAWRKGVDDIHSNDLASLVYTSGALNNPECATLNHRNFVASSEACRQLVSMTAEDVGLIFLPLAHILGRVTQFYQIYQGFIHAYAEDSNKFISTIGQVRPHFLVGIPQIFETAYQTVRSQLQSGSHLKKSIFAWAIAVGQETDRKLQAKQKVGLKLLLGYKLASFLVFNKMKKRLGGRLRYAISGEAPLSREMTEFFHAAGILVLEENCLTNGSL